jgi:ABC-type transport system involved in cytochrome c biogenesis permease subunit
MFSLGRRGAGYGAWGAAWILNASAVGLNAWSAAAPPLGNMYHVLVFLGVCFLPAHLALRWRDGAWVLDAYFSFVSALPLAGPLFMDRDATWRMMPALQSPWFIPHVAAYVFSYALCAVAFAATVVARLRGRDAGGADDGMRTGVERVTRLAFPFMTFGLVSGALWAEKAWGAFWSWDSKETWALITWLLYAMYLHACRDKRTMHQRDLIQVTAFSALLCTFLLVNLLPRLASVLHSYAR